MEVVVLASGSKGNATYVATPKTKILIDAGINMLQIKSRLQNQGVTLTNLDGVFISHEHTDHVHYLASILARTNATLYIGEESYRKINAKTNNSLLPYPKVFLKMDTKYTINDLVVVPARLSHDSVGIFGYLLKQLETDQNVSFASITDTGFIPERYLPILASIRVLMIESNHDVEMLMASRRPWPLINRILSERGHMSNETCAQYLTKITSHRTKQVILAHLSEECNTEEMARLACYKMLGEDLKFELKVAEQHTELPLIKVDD